MSTLSVAPAAGHPSFEGVDAVRADGGLVHIRPFAASDADALRALHSRVSDRSMYLRFAAGGLIGVSFLGATIDRMTSPPATTVWSVAGSRSAQRCRSAAPVLIR